MAMSISKTNFLDYVPVKGGRLWTLGPSISDPTGNRHFVQCEAHPEYKPQLKEWEHPEQSVLSCIQELLSKCPQCVDERNAKAAFESTRFPEGAEL